jgi:hypothetical protein
MPFLGTAALLGLLKKVSTIAVNPQFTLQRSNEKFVNGYGTKYCRI